MNVFFRYVVVLILFLGGGLVKAQSADSLLVVDDIQFDVREFHFDEGDQFVCDIL